MFILFLVFYSCEINQGIPAKDNRDPTNYSNYCSIVIDNNNFINGYEEIYYTITNNHYNITLLIKANIKVLNSKNEEYVKTVSVILEPSQSASSKEYILCYYISTSIETMILKAMNPEWIY